MPQRDLLPDRSRYRMANTASRALRAAAAAVHVLVLFPSATFHRGKWRPKGVAGDARGRGHPAAATRARGHYFATTTSPDIRVSHCRDHRRKTDATFGARPGETAGRHADVVELMAKAHERAAAAALNALDAYLPMR